jgi:hypothetical protein
LLLSKTIMKIKYPRFLLLFIIYIITFLLFSHIEFNIPFHSLLKLSKYVSIFFGGIFYAYGFTAAPATAILLTLSKELGIFQAGIIGGLGALISDIIIFLFIRHTFINEINNLEKEKIIISICKLRRKLFKSSEKYLLPTVASFFIASPLPTEIGVTLLASSRNMSAIRFAIIAYLLHTLGIFTILLIGKAI